MSQLQDSSVTVHELLLAFAGAATVAQRDTIRTDSPRWL
jgi:hypothetical protein